MILSVIILKKIPMLNMIKKRKLQIQDTITSNQIVIKDAGHFNSESRYTEFENLFERRKYYEYRRVSKKSRLL